MEHKQGIERLNETVRKVVAYTLVSVGILAVLFLFLFDNPMVEVYGLAAGAAAGLFAFIDLKNTLIRASTKRPEKAKIYASFRYFIRFSVLGILFALMIRSPQTGIPGAIAGFLVIKIVVYATHLFNSRDYYKKILGRREIDGK